MKQKGLALFAVGVMSILGFQLPDDYICWNPLSQRCGGGFLSWKSSGLIQSAIARYEFNDPSDLGADSGRNGYDLTPVNTPTATGGATGYAADFTAASSQVAFIADTASLDPVAGESFGWAGWGRPESITGSDWLLSKGDAAQAGEYDSYFNGGNFFCRLHDGVGTISDDIAGGVVGTRQFFTCRYNATANTIEAGADGSWSGSATSTAADSVDTNDDFVIASRTSDVPARSSFYDGVAGSFVFYKASGGQVLTDAITTSLYNSGKGKTCDALTAAEQVNLVSCWDMDEDGGPYADSIGSNTLTGVNTPSQAAALVEQPESGMSTWTVAASSQNFTLADNADMSTGDVAHTWACWVNPNTVAASVILDKADEYQLGIDAGDDFYFKGGAGAGDTATDTGFTAAVGTWYFVSGGYDLTSYWVRVNDRTRVEDAAGAAPADTANALAIGSTTAGASYFDGATDSCLFWKKALGDAQLETVYNSGVGTFYAFDWTWEDPLTRFAFTFPEITKTPRSPEEIKRANRRIYVD